MSAYYLVPVTSKIFFVGEDSFNRMLERINPELSKEEDLVVSQINSSDCDDSCSIYKDSKIPEKLVICSDGDVLYEAETTIGVTCSDLEFARYYEADPMDVLQVFVDNEDYADFAGNFFKEGKKKSSDKDSVKAKNK